MYYIIIWIIWDGHLTLLLKEKVSGMIYLLVVQQPCPQTKTVGTRDENTSLDKKVQQMSGSGVDPCFEPCVRISPSAIHHYNTMHVANIMIWFFLSNMAIAPLSNVI